jgi:hypothetical protein
MAQARTRKPVKFGTCCSQVMALFLDIHTPKYKDKRKIVLRYLKCASERERPTLEKLEFIRGRGSKTGWLRMERGN